VRFAVIVGSAQAGKRPARHRRPHENLFQLTAD
jgi:hypothetical protein